MEFGGVGSNKRRDGGAKSGRTSLMAAALRRQKVEVGYDTKLEEVYRDDLNLYYDPPSYSISLEEFDRYAVERLKLLRTIERKNLEDDVTHYSFDYFSKIQSAINSASASLPTYFTMFYSKASDEEKLMARKIDHISHFLLRLAFARTDEQRRWFISLEVDFFRFKLWRMSGTLSNRQDFNFPYEEIFGEEKRDVENYVCDASFTVGNSHLQIFKVHFLHALELVRGRKVYLRGGDAYVPFSDLSGVIAAKFRSNLSAALSLLKKNIHLIEDDERLRPLLNGFEKRHIGSDTSVKSGDAVTLQELAAASNKSFPLCMKNLYDVVLKEHHLKHWGRLQLGLFFKGLGLPMDEATKFWRSNFTKRPEIDSGRFDKQYLYNIRHMYGKEGKRADYTPYSCMKVINSSVGPGDHHGCPFRHSDATPLRVKLVDAGIPQEGIKEIMNLVEQKHFQMACQKYFECTHDSMTIEGGVNHPNQYFMESRSILTGKKTISSQVTIPLKRATIYFNKTAGSADSAEPMDVEDTENVKEVFDADDDALFSTINY